MHVDPDTIKTCEAMVGKKKGPYPAPINIPIESKMTEKLGMAMESIKNTKPGVNSKTWNTIPALFMMGVQNFDKFNGKLSQKKNFISLNKGIDVYMFDVKKVKVEENTMLANYMTPGEELTLVYLFNDK